MSLRGSVEEAAEEAQVKAIQVVEAILECANNIQEEYFLTHLWLDMQTCSFIFGSVVSANPNHQYFAWCVDAESMDGQKKCIYSKNVFSLWNKDFGFYIIF